MTVDLAQTTLALEWVESGSLIVPDIVGYGRDMVEIPDNIVYGPFARQQATPEVTPEVVQQYGWTDGAVRKPAPGLWYVESASVPGAFREVVWHHDQARPIGKRQWFTCTCPAGVRNGEQRTHFCRHVLAVDRAEKARTAADTRPKPRIDGGIFVD